MSHATRRRFLQTSLAAAGGFASPGACGRHRADPPQRPLARALSLAAYSFRQYLELRQKPRPTMTLEDFVDFVAGQPLDAVELTAYYFPQTTRAYLAELKGRCTRLGLDVSGTAVGNNFCTPNAERLRTQIADVKRWIEHTSLLGGKTMRIFGGNVERATPRSEPARRCVPPFRRRATMRASSASTWPWRITAASRGTSTRCWPWSAGSSRLVRRQPGHRQFPQRRSLCRPGPAGAVCRGRADQDRNPPDRPKPQEPADLRRLTEILRTANFRGYIALEYEGSEEPRTAIPRHLATLRQLMDKTR